MGVFLFMSKKIKAFLFIMLATTVILPVLGASAVTEETTTDSAETTTPEATTLQTTATPENGASTDKSSGREARLKAYKESIKTKLTAVKEKRVAARCKAAQEKVTVVRTRMQTALANRKQAYTTISERLDSVVEKLQKAGVDTTALETARQDVKSDVALLDEAMNAYDTVLADLETMDCVADPATFQAALESARETQKSLRDQAQALRQFATTEVKALLEEMKTKLSEKTDATTQETTDGGTE